MNRYLSDLIYAAIQRFKTFRAWSDRTIDQMFGGVDPDSQLAHAFKTDAEALEEAPVPLSAHIALYAVLTFLALAIIWSIVGTLDRIVVAQGKIATRTPLIVMSPYTTSRIQQIRVQPGDHVKKGQILVSFDPAFAQADVAALEHKVKSSSAEVERLEAQLGGLPFTTTPDDPPERKTQGQIYTQEQATYAAEIAQRNSRISALNAQIKADVSAVDGLNNQLDMANKVVGIYQGLVAQKAGAPLDVMKAQSNAIDVQMRLQNTQGELKKLTDQRAETAAERASFLDKWRSDHNQQLVKARQDLAEASETLNKARQMKEYADLRAPANAVVLEIADRSVGSVMKEAETLVTLVPDGADLYAEANVPARDVSHLKVGNTVRVKLEAYPFQKYGTIDGRLDVLSADSVPLKEDEKTQLVYHARVRLLTPMTELAKRGLRVRPGMVLSAEIKTGKRTIASYVMNPILRTADEGMREP
jgi:HlyD family secretion protein